ncbi:Arc family DNA-binding protein [Rhodovastum atsumiense]
MPHALKERVEAAARASGRSINAELVDRIERSFADSPAGAEAFLRQIAQALEELQSRGVSDLRLSLPDEVKPASLPRAGRRPRSSGQ